MTVFYYQASHCMIFHLGNLFFKYVHLVFKRVEIYNLIFSTLAPEQNCKQKVIFKAETLASHILFLVLSVCFIIYYLLRWNTVKTSFVFSNVQYIVELMDTISVILSLTTIGELLNNFFTPFLHIYLKEAWCSRRQVGKAFCSSWQMLYFD